MDWKEKYARSFIEKPIEKEEVLKLINEFKNIINNYFKENEIKEEVILEEEKNRIIFPDCIVSYDIKETRVKFTKFAKDNSSLVEGNLFIIWNEGIYRIQGGLYIDNFSKGNYLLDDNLIEDTFKMLLHKN